MALTTLLLRLLLSVSLLLNGAGDAFASPHPPVASHAETNGAPGPSTTHGKPPCHGAGEAIVDHSRLPIEAGSDLPEDASDPSGTDCCSSGACRCACMHGSAAVPPMVARRDVVPGHDMAARRPGAAHAAPVLPHLIRPPIG